MKIKHKKFKFNFILVEISLYNINIYFVSEFMTKYLKGMLTYIPDQVQYLY